VANRLCNNFPPGHNSAVSCSSLLEDDPLLALLLLLLLTISKLAVAIFKQFHNFNFYFNPKKNFFLQQNNFVVYIT
jgi:hypothetical protein